jgi:hypothetical protein
MFSSFPNKDPRYGNAVKSLIRREDESAFDFDSRVGNCDSTH